MPHIAILGAGPAGAGAAYQLARLGKAEVTVLEAADVVGGTAGSFEWHGHRLDFGSHRLHPATDPVVLADIKQLMGDDLLDRPRHGRIRLRGRWIHFPLKPVDLMLRADKGFVAGTLSDMVRKTIGRAGSEGNSFASVLEANLGRTICRDFYFPFAVKLWGHAPEELSAIQARRRVAAGSFGKLIKKVLGSVPGFGKPGAGRFYYPTRSFGAVTEAYAEGARAEGVEFRFRSRVTGLRSNGSSWTVSTERGGETHDLDADFVWSTLPVTLLPRIVRPEAPPEVAGAAASMRFRSMILVYLHLPVDHFTDFDAHYFPGADIPITRLSETKNYAARTEPRGTTVICAELPCSQTDVWWSMSDQDLGAVVADALSRAGVPLPVPATDVLTRRLTHAYPIYLHGYEAAFQVVDRWASTLPRLLSYGRQGLFAHDNTHHALAMAYAAADCLRDGSFDGVRWDGYRKDFESHVVED
ncbi:MAG: FAD-dependent oxidoreductase [Gemmatimonadota bacterium]